MRIIVDENGNVSPQGAAELLSEVGVGQNLQEGVDSSNGVSVRNFQCIECENVFECPAGEMTVHECSPG